MALPEHPHVVLALASSIKECELGCLGNCLCAAYDYNKVTTFCNDTTAGNLHIKVARQKSKQEVTAN